jgi:arabinogalactan endo-1,4-beta-galactosidase
MAHRADSMGYKVMIDFHYSDTWADPGHQTKPAAWVGHTFAQLLTDIYNHTYDVLDTLKSIGIIPAWVQVGNETNNGMVWPDGNASNNMKNFADMVNSGYDAIKAIDSSILVIVQLSDGYNNTMYRRMFDGLKNNGARWDVIGMSQYPFWANLPWDTDNNECYSNMLDMVARYGKQVMICETGMHYNQAATCKTFLLDLIAKTKSAGGLGVFYWEPECYNWQNYQMGAWDPVTKQPTVALDAFLGSNNVSVAQGNNIPFYDFTIYPNPFNPSTTINYSLPTSSNISIVIYDVLGREVVRLIDGFQSAGDHSVIWSANDVPGGVYFCRMQSGNFLKTKKIILLR